MIGCGPKCKTREGGNMKPKHGCMNPPIQLTASSQGMQPTTGHSLSVSRGTFSCDMLVQITQLLYSAKAMYKPRGIRLRHRSQKEDLLVPEHPRPRLWGSCTKGKSRHHGVGLPSISSLIRCVFLPWMNHRNSSAAISSAMTPSRSPPSAHV